MSQKNNEREAVILGALLHDVGKFVQRSQEHPKNKKHQEWGIEWFQQQNGLRENPRLASVFSNDELKKIDSAIGSHHDAVDYVSLADGISAGMERITLSQEEENDPFTSRMVSIFSRISVSDKPKPNDKYYELTKLNSNEKNIFPMPDEKCSAKDYKSLLTQLDNEIKSLNFKQYPKIKAIDTIHNILRNTPL